MKESTASVGANGIGLGGAVFLVFLVLKLTGHIDWSWWWVTAPLWGAVALFVLVIVLVIVLAVGVVVLTEWLRQRRRKRGTLR